MEHYMKDIQQPPSRYSHTKLASRHAFDQLYTQSIEQPEIFWTEQAQTLLTWQTPFSRAKGDIDLDNGQINWFVDGQLNVAVNCIDRHLTEHKSKTALIWEADEPGQHILISYQELYNQVGKLGNALLELGVKKGDRVCIYMPMIPQAAYAMLACARIGAVHSVVFGGFSPEALKDRIQDADAKILITADESIRGGKITALKANADQAVSQCSSIEKVICVAHSKRSVPWDNTRDLWYHDLITTASNHCPPAVMNAEDPLFILYTSGSTGKPKGVLHTTAGYLLQATLTFQYVLDINKTDIYWCTADVGWITGHSYIVYGPLASGATSLMFEGVPTYPTAARSWQICDTHNVSIFYTAPTAIRALMSKGDRFLEDTSRQSLKLLGTVGEPINQEAWHWYFTKVGQSRCPIVDTWWQTETGSIMMSPIPGIHAMKPGAAMIPFLGIQPVILDQQGQEIQGPGSGYLAIKQSWPSQIRSVYGNHQRCIDTYYQPYPGYYFSGDGARRDEDGDYWITGRVDDVLNVSGHRLGTAEIESAFVLHPQVAEAAVVGCPHPIKGQGIYAFITLMDGVSPSDQLAKELTQNLLTEIGPIAKPDYIQWADALPKTRSGKIMRRVLRKIGQGDIDELGDLSTLADPEVVQALIRDRQET